MHHSRLKSSASETEPVAADQRQTTGNVQQGRGNSFRADQLRGKAPLPFQEKMEAAFGQDFSGVKVRRAEPGSIAEGSASAQGDEVAFASASPSEELVAHELVHVVQHRNDGAPDGTAPQVSRPDDSSELEAERVARTVVEGGPAQVREAPSAAIHRADGENETAAQRIARVIADEDAPAICSLTDDDLAATTAGQRAGMVLILTSLMWTGDSEESMTMRLIEHGGQSSAVLATLASIGLTADLVASIDDDVLAARLATLIGSQQPAASPLDPGVAAALASRDSADVLVIESFGGLDRGTLLGLLQILLSMSSSNDVEEAAMVNIVAQDPAGLMGDLTALGLKQSLFDHVDAEANKKRLTDLLQALGDPSLDADLLVFNGSFLGNLWDGISGGFWEAVENFSLGAVGSGLLVPILHPVDTALAMIDQAIALA
jgi:Domain of unknown function (DUF4157)